MVLWALGLGLIGLLAVIYRHKTYWRNKGIPYIDTFPILGAMSSTFFRTKSFPQLAQDLYYECPGASYFGCMDFNIPVIVIKDPEMVKEIGVKSFDYFPNHRSFVEEEFDPLLSRNIFSLQDDRWRQMRTTLSPSFTANKMKFMFRLVAKCSVDFVQYLKDHPEIRKDLDMKDVYTRYTNDVIATAAFGISVDSMKDPNNEFYESGKDAVNFNGFFRLVKFVGARMFPKFMRMLGLSFLTAKTDRFFKSLVHDTVTMRETKGIVRPDMIHLLMQARDNEKGIEMTTDDIIAQAFIFFLAGFDTSSRLMCFVSHVLSHHPDIQERLREEVDTVLGDEEGDITYDTLVKMKYMDMVLSETLRLYSPVSLNDRVCVKAYTLPPAIKGAKEYVVQPNTTIWIPAHGFHRDPNYFPEPNKFDPERFNDDNKNDIIPYTYMPFGFGPRKCIGERFALMETKILLAHLLQNFVFKPSPKARKDIIFSKESFQVKPEDGFWMKLETRE